ncbi:hypothetical protein BJ742DRAFT_734058 [Cladochytrium replicatum]|nr:hypothetical protein BJ742DRAFT_734058 [Cladochytrium replicatum]
MLKGKYDGSGDLRFTAGNHGLTHEEMDITINANRPNRAFFGLASLHILQLTSVPSSLGAWLAKISRNKSYAQKSDRKVAPKVEVNQRASDGYGILEGLKDVLAKFRVISHTTVGDTVVIQIKIGYRPTSRPCARDALGIRMKGEVPQRESPNHTLISVGTFPNKTIDGACNLVAYAFGNEHVQYLFLPRVQSSTYNILKSGIGSDMKIK